MAQNSAKWGVIFWHTLYCNCMFPISTPIGWFLSFPHSHFLRSPISVSRSPYPPVVVGSHGHVWVGGCTALFVFPSHFPVFCICYWTRWLVFLQDLDFSTYLVLFCCVCWLRTSIHHRCILFPFCYPDILAISPFSYLLFLADGSVSRWILQECMRSSIVYFFATYKCVPFSEYFHNTYMFSLLYYVIGICCNPLFQLCSLR